MVNLWQKLKNECSNLRKNLVRIYQWGVAILVIIVPFALIWSLPGIFFIFFALFYFVCIIAFLSIFIKLFNNCPSYTKGLITKYPSNRSEKEYHAIIIAHRDPKKPNGDYPDSDYLDGIDILINYFLNYPTPIPFEILEVSTIEKTISAICNPKAQYLWIFGHGQRNMLGLQDGSLCYKEIKTPILKRFVGQYHCNSPFGTSLADIAQSEYCDVTIFPRFPIFTRWAIKRKLKELEKKKMFDSF